MVSVEYAVRVVGTFLRECGENFLASKIVEIGKKHNDNLKLTDKERVLIGLRYYEFLSEDTSDNEYSRAIQLTENLRNKFGIDFDKLVNDCKLLGWY